MLAMVLCITGCKDEESASPVIELPVIEQPRINPFTQTDLLSDIRDSIRVDFCLMNEEGDTTTAFREGEDIVFDLRVQSFTNDLLSYGNEYALFSEKDSLFRVYAADGSNMGTPVHLPEVGELQGKCMSRKTGALHFQSSWFGAAVPKASYPLVQLKGLSALPPGEYYVAAPVHVLVDYRITRWPPVSENDWIAENDSIYFNCGTHFTVGEQP